GRSARMSIVEEGPERKVRMANLAVVGAHAVNGVAALHTELLKKHTLHDFADMMPERFSNKTNGVTPRRWLLHCNPRLAQAITDAIGDKWATDLDQLERLLALANDAAFLDRIKFIKEANKRDLASYMHSHFHLKTDPASIFDVQI